MKLHITHRTLYTFPSPVSLYPHVFRFKPRDLRIQDIRNFSLEISPKPAGFVENRDAAGNEVQFAWFDVPASEFHILAEMTVETFVDNPLDFIIFPFESTHFPVVYRSDDDVALIPFLNPISEDAAVRAFADGISRDCGHALIPFVLLLITRIHGQIEHIIRETGEPLEPARTLERCNGSCRDQVVLALAALRYKGIAARFVSGYQYIDDDASHDLHAWVEVYFPGGGWRGFDPTTGHAVDERYVRVAAGAAPVNTLPVTGSFAGAAGSSLETEIRIRRRL
jgi:transglutaminase-like putative cysteine protease